MSPSHVVAAPPFRRSAQPIAIPPGNCPCGRACPLQECCLPLARRLRRGGGERPSPFDEIRATAALLLWSLLAREAPSGAVRGALSVAARRFWGPVLATALDGGATAPLLGAPAGSADSAPPPAGGTASLAAAAHAADHDPAGIAGPADDYGDRLFERTWGCIDADTLAWLLGALPSYLRADPLLGELALDWILWDRPWLRGRAAGHWTARSRPLARRRRVQSTYRDILRSRVGLWVLEEAIPGTGFRLADRLTGRRTLLHTASDPWPDAGARLLLARVYDFGHWQLLGGRCLLLDPIAVDELLTAINARRRALDGPSPRDPRWRGWLKAELIPLVAGQWVGARLATSAADGRDVGCC